MTEEQKEFVRRVETIDKNESFRRLSTGSTPADRILGGGFPVNSTNIIMGEPGTGKTLFAEQLVFHNATGDRPILYLTTLSEPLAKVVMYLQRYDFFDAEKLGTSVIYDEVGTELAEEGVEALVPKVKERIKQLRPKIIVIDSFKALHDIAPSLASMRRVVHDLAGLLTAYDTTAFLVGEYSKEQIATYPEFVVADGIVELLRHETGMRDDRYFRVRKLRGSHYREGMHAVQLTSAGVEIYRRLVSPQEPPPYLIDRRRLSTGIPGLDEMLHGGLWEGSTTLLGGPTGSGKTSIGLKFVMEGARMGEAGLYVHLEENPTQLAHLFRGFGMSPDDANLHLLYFSPVELQIDSMVDQMFRMIRERSVKRIVIDAVGDLITATRDAQRLHDYLYALSQHFAVKGVTGVFTFETARPGITGKYTIDAPFSHLSDNILLLEVEIEAERTRRKLRVIKTRGSGHDPRVRDVNITVNGIEFPLSVVTITMGPTIPPVPATDRRFEQLRKLTEISRALTYTMEIEDVLRLATDRAADLLDAQSGLLMLTDDTGLLRVRATHGVAEHVVERFREGLDETLIHRLQGLLDAPLKEAFLGVPLVVHGNVTGLLAVVRPHGNPITDEEEWLLSAVADQIAVAVENARLEEEVRSERERRAEAVEGAGKADETNERALATLSHDLRSPLNAIDSYAELIEMEIMGSVTDRQREALGRIRLSGRHLLAVLENVLEMTRLTAGVVRVQTDSVPASSVVEEAIFMVRPSATAKGQTIRVEHASRAVLEADPNRLRQVLVNLVGNAIKYTQPGGAISVTVATTEHDGATWGTIAVSDTGPGIPSEKLQAIFQPYYRLPTADGEGSEGAGLGLAISRELIRQMKGELTVESELGEGSTFMLRLPVATEIDTALSS